MHEAAVSTPTQISDASASLIRGVFFIIGLFGFGTFRDLCRIDISSRHAVFLCGPFIEIDQLASFRTKRPPGIVLPFNLLATRRTFRHRAKVRRKKAKVKAG